MVHILNPRFKSAFIEDTQIPVLKQAVRNAIQKYNASQPSSVVDQAVGSYLHEFDTLLPRSESLLCDEIDRDFEMPRRPYTTNPLGWWKDMRSTYPTIFKTALIKLTIPATSVPSERLFTTASNIYDKKRGNLSKEAARSILFLHENWKTVGLDDVLPAPGIHPPSISNSEVDNPPPEDDTDIQSEYTVLSDFSDDISV